MNNKVVTTAAVASGASSIDISGSLFARTRTAVVCLLIAGALSACGGGSGDTTSSTAPSVNALNLSLEPDAPTAVGNTATDGFNWFNYRRQQIGLSPVGRNSLLDRAAQAHADYQQINNVISHEETPGAPGYTGAELGGRLASAGYDFTVPRYAYGEVISATASRSGFSAAEDLITAIYHRFVIFEPSFSEAGSGVASVDNGYTYFTTNFAANGLGAGLGTAGFVTYPRANQRNVAPGFFSDREIPDPVPERNEVGFPISLHADIASSIRVSSFSLRPRGGAPLAVRLLTSDTDPDTPEAAAAIVPIDVLAGSTIYDVQFAGTVGGVAVTRNWSFTTR